jgi:arylsulfatase A-like enzyme/Flp pilus assembly protein TadD
MPVNHNPRKPARVYNPVPMSISRLLLALAMAISFALSAAAADHSKTPTNVVFITIDTLRADHLGCYGYKNIRTPNIDALALDSVKFERAFTPIPITLPSHTVIFTGTYPMLNGMHDFSGNRLGPQQQTLASVMKDRGYTTGAVVASAVLDSRFGLNRGFDFYYDHFDFNRLEESNLDEMERPGHVVAEKVIEWLSQNSQRPFLLWMHLYDPHYPYRPPPPYNDEYKTNLYDGEIAFADAQVGRLLHYLKEKGLYQKTLIVLSGDHGEGLGEHGEKTHGFFIYNSTLHIPLLIHLPRPPGINEVSAPVSTVDIMPTVLKILGIPVPSQVQGKSLLPLIFGNKQEETPYLYAETFLPRLHFDWSELRALENDHYHFILAPKPELYDLSKDPKELHNLCAEKPAVSDELKAKLSAVIHEYTPGQELADKAPLDPALMERLKSLGYAGFSGGGSGNAKNSELPDPKDRIQTYELISEAIEASQHGNYEPSIEKLNEALKTEPKSVPVHYLQGLNYYRLGHFPDAVSEFQKVLQLSPDYALAAFHLGLAYARTGQADEAIATFKKTLELDSTNFSASYDLGLLYEQKKMTAEAAAAFRHSVQVAPAYLPGHMALGQLLLGQGQVDEAIAELRQAVSLAPEQPGTHMALAKALESKGLTVEAQQEIRRAQEVSSHP